MVSFPWSSLSFHPTPTFIPSGRRWGEEGMTLEVLLNQAFVCIVQAQGFLMCRLSCPVISPHGKRAAFSGTDPCGEKVTSAGGLLLYSAASEIARCWGKMQRWDTLSLLLGSFLGPWKKWYSIWGPNAWFQLGMVGSLTFHSCNCKQSLMVRLTVNFLWMLLLFRENKYFPPLVQFPLHLCLKQVIGAGIEV